MTIALGLFDIFQIDPLEQADHNAVYRRHLDDLALADELGFELAFTASRHFMQHYRCPAPVAWLAAASQRTSRMRLGALAFTLPIHPPVQLAEELAVLDQLTGGRLEVGVGLGHRTAELVSLGVDPDDRVPIFQQRLTIMEALWAGHQVTIEEGYDTVIDVALTPLPAQRPHPPLWYAGTDPGATGWAGKHGMSLAVGFAPMKELYPATVAFRTAAASRATDPEETTERPGAGRVALMRHTLVADSDEQARREMIEDLYRLGSLGAQGSGSRSDRRAEAEAEQARLIKEEVFLAGSPETVANQIATAGRMLGISIYLANVYGAAIDAERTRRSLRLLAGPVRDALTARMATAD